VLCAVPERPVWCITVHFRRFFKKFQEVIYFWITILNISLDMVDFFTFFRFSKILPTNCT
jgi:hypothetical protein